MRLPYLTGRGMIAKDAAFKLDAQIHRDHHDPENHLH